MEEEQITNNNTNIETPQIKKQKDPRKVEAGKALAKRNAEAKKNKKNEEISPQEEDFDISTFYDGAKSIAGVVGVGLTLYHGWKFFYSPTTQGVDAVRVPNPPTIPTIPTVRKTPDF